MTRRKNVSYVETERNAPEGKADLKILSWKWTWLWTEEMSVAGVKGLWLEMSSEIWGNQTMQSLEDFGFNFLWDGKPLEASEQRSNLNYILQELLWL